MRSWVIILLSLATWISLTWGYREHRLVKQLRREKSQVVERQAGAESTIVELREKLGQQQRATEVMKSQYEAAAQRAGAQPAPPLASAERLSYEKVIQALKANIARKETAKPAAVPGSSDEAGQSASAPGKPMMAELARMMKNPEMKKLIATQQKAMLDMAYGSLYGLLDLPADKMGTLKGLLEKKQTEATSLGLEMLDNTLTDAQKAEKRKQMTALSAQTNKEIEALLGKKDYTLYKAYEETQAERMQVHLFNQSLGADLQLNEIQQNDLVFAMHKLRSEFKFTTGLEKQNAMPDPSKVSPEQLNRFLAENRQLNQQYVDLANKMLTPAQAGKMRDQLEQQQAMQELGIKMFFGGAGSEKATKTPVPVIKIEGGVR